MYVSARLDYALRALAALATEDGPVTAALLAERQGASVGYVAAILHELRREGILVNARGRRGGYRLARPASEISVADVVSALRVWPVDVHGTNGAADEIGERLALLWERVGSATVEVLASVSVAGLALGAERVGVP